MFSLPRKILLLVTLSMMNLINFKKPIGVLTRSFSFELNKPCHSSKFWNGAFTHLNLYYCSCFPQIMETCGLKHFLQKSSCVCVFKWKSFTECSWNPDLHSSIKDIVKADFFFLEIYKSNGRFNMSCLFTGIIIRTTVFQCHLRRIYLNSVVNISEWCDDNTCHFFKKQSVTCIYINIFFFPKMKGFC